MNTREDLLMRISNTQDTAQRHLELMAGTSDDIMYWHHYAMVQKSLTAVYEFAVCGMRAGLFSTPEMEALKTM